MHKHFFALMLLLLLLCTGCFRKEYEVQVINDTPYLLNEVEVQMYHFKDSFSLVPGETSQVHTLSYRYTPLNLFAEGGLGLAVQKYSVDSVVLPYEMGIFVMMHELSGDDVSRFAITEEKDTTGKRSVDFGFERR